MNKEAKRSLIILYHNGGKSASVISKILSISRWIVYRTIKRYKETGSTQEGSENVDFILFVLLLVEARPREGRENPVRSIQGMAKDYNISTRSMVRIVKEDLGLKYWKFLEVQLLSEKWHIITNSRILAPDQNSISSSIHTIKRTQKPASVIIWVAITSDAQTPLVCIDKGAKINKEVCALKPWAGEHFNGTHWVFQQDSVPSHKAK
ncbi:hypothetical protein LOD99_11011 [Oopsacas minuta]|uniref:Transposase n=1 Tax=Oopsacas minuta TaxID=111878 RepID=A0AAV7KC63_9METZ|nr:hypothetical protein LOD99_11011 [Oopsacas minuta]